MFMGYGSVMRAEQPSLQERHNLVDVREQLRRRPGLPFEKCDPVLVAVTSKRLVAEPAVGVDPAPGFNRVLHERHQAPR